MQLVTNKKALHDYTILKTLAAGVVLSGGEVKSLRLGHGSLVGSFVKVIGNEAFILGAQINPYAYADNREYDPKRTRKLLLKRSEIESLKVESQEKGLTLVPLSWNVMGRRVKLMVGLARGKKLHDHRAELKKRAQQRDVARELKDRVRYHG